MLDLLQGKILRQENIHLLHLLLKLFQILKILLIIIMMSQEIDIQLTLVNTGFLERDLTGHFYLLSLGLIGVVHL